MIQINKVPGQRILELGGGSNRHPMSDCNVDCQALPGVDFVADFDKPLPIKTGEWDGVLSIYALEHVGWRSMRQFMSEVFRVLKPGGKAIFVTPNLEAQVHWAQQNQNGWDGKPFFESASEIIFGSQNYNDNTHKSWVSPPAVIDLFQRAGFEEINVTPHGERNTDLAIMATKPVKVEERLKPEAPKAPAKPEGETVPLSKDLTSEERAGLFDVHYWNGGSKVGGYAGEGYWDFPIHEATVEAVMRRKPGSILELGAARGYLGKRFEDRGIPYTGLEISRHCWLSRVCEGVKNHDVCEGNWPAGNLINGPFHDNRFDLCLSIAFLEHVPEAKLPILIAEMERTCKRGLHGIDLGAKDDGFDRTHCTLRDYKFWRSILPTGHEVVDKEELEHEGDFPAKILTDPEKRVKLNVGCGICMYHHGWVNCDTNPAAGQIAQMYKYAFMQQDARQGFPYPTSSVELIHLANFLPWLTYKEAREVLRELRRCVKPDGLMRVAVTDCGKLGNDMYWDNEVHLPAGLSQFNEISLACKEAMTDAEKLWALTKADGQLSSWDSDTLLSVLDETGWEGTIQPFRICKSKQMLAEMTDTFPALSLYCDAEPKMGG